MSDLIGLLLAHALDPADEPRLRDEAAAHAAAVADSAGRGNRAVVREAEQAVRADPAAAFAFDGTGAATLTAAGQAWDAGRFETPTIGDLRGRVSQSATGPAAGGSRVRLWVLDGAGPVTDIGSLQATSGDDTLFQVASQFNCLESPGPYVVPVSDYFSDPTQGPRASISAFPATLLRHYAAPAPDGGGGRFVQQSDGPQVDLLADACGPGASRNGYFTGEGAADPAALAARLEEHFDRIRVGVHDAAQVVLGYNWDGVVDEAAAGGPRRIAQVFTSTVAGGGYAGQYNLGPDAFRAACRQLLRAAYLGTLLAAVAVGRRRVVLTLIGGGVFGNPIPLIWRSIQWAVEQVEPLLADDMDVVVNGRNLGHAIDLEADVVPVVAARGGAVVTFDRAGLAEVRR